MFSCVHFLHHTLSQFIKDVEDPVEVTKEKFHNNNLLDDVIYKELTVVQQGVASGMKSKDLVRRLGNVLNIKTKLCMSKTYSEWVFDF